jgi:hypothetical protein
MKRPKTPSKNTLARSLKEAQAAVEAGKQQAAYWKGNAEAAEAKRKQQVAGLADSLAEARRRLEAMTDAIVKSPRCEVGAFYDRCIDTAEINGVVRVCCNVSIRSLTIMPQVSREALHAELANRLAEMVHQKVLTDIRITP